MTTTIKTSREGIKYMKRSEANKIFYDLFDVDRIKKKLGDDYDRKKNVILLKIRRKAYTYRIKKNGRNEFDKYLKEWVKRFY